MLKSTVIFIGLSLLVAPLSFSQSLADVAKKEKKRRESVDGDTKTIDDWQLRQAKGDTLSVTGSEVSDEESSRVSDKPSSPSPTSASPSSATPSKTPDAKELRQRRESHAKQVAAARAALESAQAYEKECRLALRRPGSVYVVDNGCEAAAGRVRGAQSRLNSLLSNRP